MVIHMSKKREIPQSEMPLIRYEDPETGMVVYPSFEIDGNGGYRPLDPTHLDGMIRSITLERIRTAAACLPQVPASPGEPSST